MYTIEQCLGGGERGDEMLGLALDPSVDPRFEPQKTEPWSERLPRLLPEGPDKIDVALVALLQQAWERS